MSPSPPPVPRGGIRLPPGYRWIAMRPGAAPTARRRRRALSPTPRYPVNPGWTLQGYSGEPVPAPVVQRSGPGPALVGSTLRATAIVLAVAAAVHALRYILLVINRDTLLPSPIAWAGLWLPVVASAAALAAVLGCAIVLTRWLIARRAAVYAHHRVEDPRPAAALWLGCLTPVVNLVWAPVFVIETATFEGFYHRVRTPIRRWWVLWVLSTMLAIFAIATSFATDAQGIADNTMTSTLAYLLAFVVVRALTRVYDGFVAKPVDRPAHRWVMVGGEPAPVPAELPAEPAPDAADDPVADAARHREPVA